MVLISNIVGKIKFCQKERDVKLTKYVSPRFLFALIRNICLKARYGRAIKINIFKVYFESNVKVSISAGGSVEIASDGDRVYFTRGTDIVASGGAIRIGSGTFFNKGCTIVSHSRIDIGEDVMFGPNCAVYDSDHKCEIQPTRFRHQGYVMRSVHIGSNVWVGQNSVITKGAILNDSLVLAANSVARGTLESGWLHGGSPAKPIKSLLGSY